MTPGNWLASVTERVVGGIYGEGIFEEKKFEQSTDKWPFENAKFNKLEKWLAKGQVRWVSS